MSFYLGTEGFDRAPESALHFGRQEREEVDGGASGDSPAARLIRAVLANEYAWRFRDADGKAWIAAKRLW